MEIQTSQNITTKRPVAYWLSKAVSYLMHPFLMPVWLLVVVFAVGIIPPMLRIQVRNYIVGVVVINTVLLPAMAIILMKLFGVIKDYSLSTRHDRIFPLIIVALCYGLCGWMLGAAPELYLLKRMMLTAMLCTVFAMVVNFWWQISLHMTAAGAAVGMLTLFMIVGTPNIVVIYCLLVLLTGLLGSARLYLGKHTPAQVGLGFLGGFLISTLTLLFWL